MPPTGVVIAETDRARLLPIVQTIGINDLSLRSARRKDNYVLHWSTRVVDLLSQELVNLCWDLPSTRVVRVHRQKLVDGLLRDAHPLCRLRLITIAGGLHT